MPASKAENEVMDRSEPSGGRTVADTGPRANLLSSFVRSVTQQRLDLHIFVEAKLAPLAPVTTLLVATERRIEIKPIVDRYPAGAQLAGHGASLLDVCGSDVAGKAVFRVVGDPDGLVDVVVAQDGEHGPE